MSVNYTDDSITSDINSSSSQFHQKGVVVMLKSDSNQIITFFSKFIC